MQRAHAMIGLGRGELHKDWEMATAGRAGREEVDSTHHIIAWHGHRQKR